MIRKTAFILILTWIWCAAAPAIAQDDEPPWADEYQSATNFLACRGNGYALCYYSGPDEHQPTKGDTPSPRLPCAPNGPNSVNCTCYALDDGVYQGELTYNYVEVGSILDPNVLRETQEVCGVDGSNCLNMVNLRGLCHTEPGVIAEAEECQAAPVCSYLGDPANGVPQSLYPHLDDVTLISTFSFAYSDVHYFGSTPCTPPAIANPVYAGCMTAPCRQGEDGLVTCDCPLYPGPYQVGQNYRTHGTLQCDIEPNFWSAAYHEDAELE